VNLVHRSSHSDAKVFTSLQTNSGSIAATLEAAPSDVDYRRWGQFHYPCDSLIELRLATRYAGNGPV